MRPGFGLDDDELKWPSGAGLLPAVVQDAVTGRVLMLAWMSPEALRHTRESGWVTFWSRSRQRLWTKGETSGNRLRVVQIEADCDRDALLVTARPQGPACHTGDQSCFDGGADPDSTAGLLGRLERVIAARQESGDGSSYTARLLAGGLQEIAKKVGEEGVEVAVSAGQAPERSVAEAADLVYHLLVFLRARGLSMRDVLRELEERRTGC